MLEIGRCHDVLRSEVLVHEDQPYQLTKNLELKLGAEDYSPLSPVERDQLVRSRLKQELNRPFDQVKTQIANKLYREKRTKEFDEYVKKLKEDAKINVNEGELDKIVVAAASPTPPQGMPPGMQPVQPQPGTPASTTPPPPGQPHGASPAPAQPPHP